MLAAAKASPSNKRPAKVLKKPAGLKRPACKVLKKPAGLKEEEKADEAEEEGEEEEEKEDDEEVEPEVEGDDVHEEAECMVSVHLTHARSGTVRAYLQGKFVPSGKKRLLAEWTEKNEGDWNPFVLFCVWLVI